MSTVSTRRFSRAGTPSSILSSDSDIRFTRKLGGQYRCGCCVLAAFLLFLLFSGVSIYLGCKYRSCRSSTGNIKVYKTFRSYLKSFYAKNLNFFCVFARGDAYRSEFLLSWIFRREKSEIKGILWNILTYRFCNLKSSLREIVAWERCLFFLESERFIGRFNRARLHVSDDKSRIMRNICTIVVTLAILPAMLSQVRVSTGHYQDIFVTRTLRRFPSRLLHLRAAWVPAQMKLFITVNRQSAA